METIKHIADFSYCKTCKHKDTKDVDEHCHSCMETEYVEATHYPISYDGPKYMEDKE